MFYSQLLLSKKGALGIVWMAAHCHKRLKKEQVQQTDISSSVDKIMCDEVQVVSHRILAFLLLGVVRIYSKKVEYLFHDCHELLNKVHGFGKGKGVDIVTSQRRYGSITLPKRFELDAFDLELMVDQDLVGGNVTSNKKLILGDGGQTRGLFDKNNILLLEAPPGDHTPPRDVLSPHLTGLDLLVIPSYTSMSSYGKEIICGTGSLLEDRLDPMDLDEDEEHNIRSHSIPSMEIVRGARFSLGDHVDPMALDECEKELNAGPSNGTDSCGLIQDAEFDPVANPSPLLSDSVQSLGIIHQIGFSSEDSPKCEMLSDDEKGQGLDEHGVEEEYPLTLHEDKSREFTESVDKLMPVVKKMKLLEVIATENVCQIVEEFPLSIVTPDLKLPAGVGTSEVATLQTPAPKEQRRIFKKQKIRFDSTTKVPAETYRRWISNPTDIKREKKKVSSSRLHVWRADKLGRIPQSFFEPLISGISSNLGSLEYETSRGELIKPVESGGQDDAACPDDQEILDVRSPVKEHSPKQIQIAPATPVSCLNSFTTAADSDNVGPANSLETMEKSVSSHEGLELEPVFREEVNSLDGETMKEDGYSTRTRMTESYLGSKFMEKKKRKEEEVLSLSQLSEGKTKKENARLFYDILVLKSRGSVDVQQEKGYDDILLKRHTN